MNLLVVANKAFGFTPECTLNMPYWLLMTMLIDFNVMNEKDEKSDKTTTKKGSGGDLGQYMR